MIPSLSPDDQVLIEALPLLAGIDPAIALELLDGARLSQWPKGGMLFTKGDVADRFFIVLEGGTHLFALSPWGDQSIIEVVGKGQSFAEGAIFAHRNFPLNGEALPGTRLIEVPAKPFLQRLTDQPWLAVAMMASLARWQRRLLTEIADIKSRTPAQRLGLFLLAQAQPVGDNQARVRLAGTKHHLASRIGIAPESLSRALVRLRPMVQSATGREFMINDVTALRGFCGGD